MLQNYWCLHPQSVPTMFLGIQLGIAVFAELKVQNENENKYFYLESMRKKHKPVLLVFPAVAAKRDKIERSDICKR